MKCLEIFAGTKSFSKEAEKAGWHCTTLDNDPKFEPSILVDIMEWDYSDLGPVDVFGRGPHAHCSVMPPSKGTLQKAIY